MAENFLNSQPGINKVVAFDTFLLERTKIGVSGSSSYLGIGYKTEDAEYYSLKEYEAKEAEKNGTIETLIFKDVDYKGEDRSVSGFLLFERSQTSFISNCYGYVAYL